MKVSIDQSLSEKISYELQILDRIYKKSLDRPDDTAISFDRDILSYKDLYLKIEILRTGLKQSGIKKNSTVAVSVYRSVDLVPLLLAIWSLGAAYVPVDPTYPSHRKKYIVNDAGSSLLVIDTENNYLDCDNEIVPLNELLVLGSGAELTSLSEMEPIEQDDIAYIIYTSGSTGDPKGVAVTQKNVANFLNSMAHTPGLSSDDKLLAVTTISFDIHVLELFLPLYQGASLILASEDESKSAQHLRSLIERHNVSIMQGTPALWRMLLSGNWTTPKPIKMLVGGEALPKDLLPAMLNSANAVWNMYGPTETTVWSTCFEIKSADQPILIGKPIDNTEVFIVNEELIKVKDGCQGELLIGGDGVSAGYYKKPALTNEKYLVSDQLSSGRLYRTGDLVVQEACGNLRYVNRIDNQIKLRGFRMEPGDIEHFIDLYDGITQSCVVVSELQPGDQRLVCFYLGEQANNKSLFDYCSKHLPRHMVPQHFVHLETFPKTENLKIDRNTLRSMGIGSSVVSRKILALDAQSELERCLISVWEDVLGVTEITTEDDFFLLGGHSLLALTAVEKMNNATGKNFTPDMLFSHGSIQRLIDGYDSSSDDEHAIVISLNTQKQGVPVYCLCGVQLYSEFAELISEENPAFGIFGSEEIAMLKQTESSEGALFDANKFAQAYVEAIKRQHTTGPLILAGFSFGGVLAIDVARRLKMIGMEVITVALIDAYTPFSSYRSMKKTFVDAIIKIRKHGYVLSFKKGWTRLANKLSSKIIEPKTITQEEREVVFDHAAKVFQDYLEPYQGDVILFKANKTHVGLGMLALEDYGWSTFIHGDVTIRSYDTDHKGIISGKCLAQMASDFRHHLTTKQG